MDGNPEAGKLLPVRPLDFNILLALAEREDYGYRIVQRIAEAETVDVRSCQWHRAVSR